jgi:branched-chain amino acid transport system permease protein
MIQVIADTLSLGSVYVLFALGLSLSWSVLNLLNLAYGAQFMLGAYFAYYVGGHVHRSLLIVLPIVVLIVAATSVIADNVVFRQLRTMAGTPVESELSMLVASIGLAAVAVTWVQHVTKGESKFVPKSVFTVHTLNLSDKFRLTNIQLIMLIVTVALTVALVVIVKWSRFGRAMRGVAVDPATCELLGVNSNRLFSTTIAISGALAGLAGVLLAIHLNYVDSNMGDPLLTKAFAIIIIGGVGSILGAAVGGYLLAFAETVTVAYGPANYRDAIAFVVILLMLLIRPTGLFARKLWERA